MTQQPIKSKEEQAKEILKRYVKDIYLFTHGTLEKREQFEKAIIEAMEAYAASKQVGEENRRLREVLKDIREYCGSRAGYNMTVIYNMTLEILNETYHPVSDAGEIK